MSRPIDAEDAKMRVLNLWAKDRPIEDACADGNMYAFAILDALDAIDDSPTADRPQGEWVDIHEDESVACRDCHKRYDWTTEAQYYNFCPNCGVPMKGADDVYINKRNGYINNL